VLYSVDFAPIEELQRQGDWAATAEIIAAAAQNVEAGGADFLLICTNTMHKVAPQVEASISIPLLHIADATGEVLQRDGIQKVGLLGTAFTMEQEFYRQRLMDRFNLEVVVPDAAGRQTVHDVIFQELCKGQIHDPSRDRYLAVIEQLSKQGAEAVILGCTEIGLLIRQEHTAVPLYDTTAIHASYAVDFALQ